MQGMITVTYILRYHFISLSVLFLFLLPVLAGQGVTQSWDDTLNKGWPEECRVVDIRSSADGSFQKAWFYSSMSQEPAPLIVSLHTWSGDYNQQDPLVDEVIRRGWNYIHPEFRGANNRPEAGASALVISDIGDAIEFALRNSLSDPEDVHIIGVSGGGYATLAAYMKLDYPVRSFSAWAAISDLNSWYSECKSRKLRYASDIEKITTGGSGFDAAEARNRSPLFMEYNPTLRRGATLSLFAGINDGYTGSVPITHSIEFYNRIADLRHPGAEELHVQDSIVINLLARRYDPAGDYPQKIAGRNVYLSAGNRDVHLEIFEGGHEMLVPHALSLLPVKGMTSNPFYEGTVLVIGDSNAAGTDSWPAYLDFILPYATVVNASIPGNTIGFDNLEKQELNTLRNAEEYLDECLNASSCDTERVVILIALGTNDTKYIFRDRQREVPANLRILINKLRERLPRAEIFVVAPPPIDEKRDTTGKYRGGVRRIKRLGGEFEKVSREMGTKLIDLYGLLGDNFNARTSDGVHLNPATRFEVASYIASLISPAEEDSGQGQDIASLHLPDTNIIIPPAWAFGILYGGYTDQNGTIELIKEVQAHDYPIDAYWIDSWFWSYADKGAGPAGYLDFAGDTISYPDRGAMWSWMERNNIKGGFWIWDCILESGNENVFREFLDRGFFSGVSLNRNSWHNKGTTTAMFSEEKKHPGTLCGNIDFDNPQTVSYFGQKLKPLFQEGADFVKLDRTDRISVCRAMYEYTATMGLETCGRGLILSHSGGTDSDEYKRYPMKWTDDTRSDWTVESPMVRFDPWVPKVALKENIAMYTNPAAATSKIPFLTNDMGGFDMGHTDTPDEELYIRWMQFSMFCPVTEVFSQPENPTSNLAWKYSPFADSLFRDYSHRRMRLFPYLYSYAHQSRLNGTDMVQSLSGQLYEYMLGNELLIAPVYEKGATTRTVNAPAGNWIDYWTGDRLEGGREHIINAPIGEIPLLVREGAVIPERPYAPSIERGSNDTLILNIYPGADGSFTLIEDDGTSTEYLKGGYATTKIESRLDTNSLDVIIYPVQGNFAGMTAARSWYLIIHSEQKPTGTLVNNIYRLFEYEPLQKETRIAAGKYPKGNKTVVRVIFDGTLSTVQ